MTNPHVVEVSKDVKWKATPGKVKINLSKEPEPSITWRPIDCNVTLFFPDQELCGENFYYIPKNKPRTLKIKKLVQDKYPYAVYCHKDKNDKDFAEGDSSPIIIIERAKD